MALYAWTHPLELALAVITSHGHCCDGRGLLEERVSSMDGLKYTCRRTPVGLHVSRYEPSENGIKPPAQYLEAGASKISHGAEGEAINEATWKTDLGWCQKISMRRKTVSGCKVSTHILVDT